MKHSKNKSYWEKEFLPKFQQIYDQNKENVFNEEIKNEFNQCSNDLKNEIEKYNKEFNKFKFFLAKLSIFFSVILLFIPFYWTWKWYKKLKNEKESYLTVIKEKEKNKLQIHSKVFSCFKFNDFFNMFNGIINYKHMGPIPNSLIEEMQSLSLFDLNSKYGKVNTNATSWGICDNKIVIHKSKQILDEFMKTYSGSTVVYTYSRNSQGQVVRTPHTVVATYDHLAYDIYSDRYTYAFMESCSNLEFNFEKESGKISSKLFNKKHNFSPLENSEFDKNYNWYRNDDVQFRMVFTPYTQETFLNEDKSLGMANQLIWKKEKAFISNEYENSQDSFIWENGLSLITKNFLTNPSMSLEEFVYSVYKSILDYYFNIFNSMNYMWLTTLMPSENHLSIIKNVLKSNEKLIDRKNISLFFHNVLSEIFKEKIIQINTECFNDIEDIIDLKSIKKHKLYKVKMKGTSFEIQEKVKIVPTFGPTGLVNVSVPYKNFIPHHGYAILYCSNISDQNNNLLFCNYETNIEDKEILKLVLDIEKEAKIFIKNGLLSVYCKNENPTIDNMVKNLLELI